MKDIPIYDRNAKVALRQRQGANGEAHLTYFDARTQASFVWNGKADAIEVSLGGYGEPVDHEIPAPAEPPSIKMDLGSHVWMFELACKAHAETLPDYGS